MDDLNNNDITTTISSSQQQQQHHHHSNNNNNKKDRDHHHNEQWNNNNNNNSKNLNNNNNNQHQHHQHHVMKVRMFICLWTFTLTFLIIAMRYLFTNQSIWYSQQPQHAIIMSIQQGQQLVEGCDTTTANTTTTTTTSTPMEASSAAAIEASSSSSSFAAASSSSSSSREMILSSLATSSSKEDITTTTTTTTNTVVFEPQRICCNNPYITSLQDTPEIITKRMNIWLDNINQTKEKAISDYYKYKLHNHNRFQIAFNRNIASCKPNSLQCLGGDCYTDESKIICGLQELSKITSSTTVTTTTSSASSTTATRTTPSSQRGGIRKGMGAVVVGGGEDGDIDVVVSTAAADDDDSSSSSSSSSTCIVYSIGGNNLWQFEESILKETSCHVHTFDCTGPKSRFNKQPNSTRSHFHHVCLGTKHEDVEEECRGNNRCGETWTLLEMQQRLHHTRIDLLKIDIEGWEWPIVESWYELSKPQSHNIVLPYQILMEVHYWSGNLGLLSSPNASHDFKSVIDLIELNEHLFKLGYVIVKRDDNVECKHCTELTLVRIHCHPPPPTPPQTTTTMLSSSSSSFLI